MMLIIALIVALVFVFAVFIRPWLKVQPWARSFFQKIEPFEIALYRKSETILAGRVLQLAGLIVAGYDSLAIVFTGLDLTPITARLFDRIPADMRPIVISFSLFLIGQAMTALRRMTTRPVELVEAPYDKTPEVAAALEHAEVAKVAAVEKVKEAETTGAL